MPPAYVNFFSTSTQASAALIGLLFVAVSLAPHRVFGEAAAVEHQMLALSTFTALVNAFFLSFTSELPNPNVGTTAIILSSLALSQTLALLFLLPAWHREKRILRGALMVVASGVVYGYELALGIALARKASDLSSLGAMLYVIVAAFAIGLVRAWHLLGASRGSGLLSQLRLLVRRAGDSATAARERGALDATSQSAEPGSGAGPHAQPR